MLQAQVVEGRLYAGEPDRAVQDLEDLMDLNLDKPDIVWSLANVFAELGRHARSNEVLELQIPLMGDDNYTA